LCNSKFPVFLSINFSHSFGLLKQQIANIIKCGLLRSLKYTTRGFDSMNNVSEYAGNKLSNLYLSMKVTKYDKQQNKLCKFFERIIMLQDYDVMHNLYCIHHMGIDFYNASVANEIPDILAIEQLAANMININLNILSSEEDY
jgi:hypothetical protein